MGNGTNSKGDFQGNGNSPDFKLIRDPLAASLSESIFMLKTIVRRALGVTIALIVTPMLALAVPSAAQSQSEFDRPDSHAAQSAHQAATIRDWHHTQDCDWMQSWCQIQDWYQDWYHDWMPDWGWNGGGWECHRDRHHGHCDGGWEY